MKTYFAVLILCLLPLQLWGAETSFKTDSSTELGQISDIQAPKCSDLAFYEKIMDTAIRYYENEKVSSSIAKRRKALKLSNIKAFESVSTRNFLPTQDYNTANALIMIKINKQVREDDIILCRQKEDVKTPVYVIAYPYMDNYQVHILNLAQKNSDYEQVSFIYP